MSEKNTKTTAGIGLFGIIFLILFILKITHQITMSWWLVTSPLWVGPVMAVILVLFILFIMFISKTK